MYLYILELKLNKNFEFRKMYIFKKNQRKRFGKWCDIEKVLQGKLEYLSFEESMSIRKK